MSQRDLIEVLTELGGAASDRAIRKAAQARGLNRVQHDLETLRGWGFVTFDPKADVWRLAEPFPSANSSVVFV